MTAYEIGLVNVPRTTFFNAPDTPYHDAVGPSGPTQYECSQWIMSAGMT